MKKVLYAAIAAALALAACAKQEAVRPIQQGEVRFTTNIQTYTVKATDTAFENGDKVGIFAGTPISKSNVQATVSGSSLIPATAIKWKEGDNGVVDFFAYYPYAENVSQSYNFAVQADQATGYAKSDLMLAAKSSAPTDNAIDLQFSHALSKVIFKINNAVENTTVNSVSFESVALGATVDLKTAAISNLDENKGNIKAAKDGNDYKLILIPQTASPKVRVSLSNGKDYVFSLASAFEFKAGKKATATLAVNPEAEAGQVEFSFLVSDWAVDDDPLVFGDPEIEEGAPQHTWSVIGSWDGWAADIPMTQNEGVWTATIDYTAGQEFKLRADNDWALSAGIKSAWDGQIFIAGNNPDPYLEENSSRNIMLEATGQYKLEFEADTYHFVVTKLGGEDPQPSETVTLTVNVYNGAGWSALNLYTWVGETPLCGAWPGMAPAATDVVVNEVTYKSFVIAECPKGVINYILNDGAGNQTADLLSGDIQNDLTVYVWLKADKSVAEIENPATFVPQDEPAPAPVWVVVGLASDWNTEHEMTQDAQDPNLWTITVTLGAEDAEKNGFKFKIKGDTTWATQFGAPDAPNNEFEITEANQKIDLVANTGSSANIIIKPFASIYDFNLYVDGDKKGELYVTKH